jgi:hypothetical protein
MLCLEILLTRNTFFKKSYSWIVGVAQVVEHLPKNLIHVFHIYSHALLKSGDMF